MIAIVAQLGGVTSCPLTGLGTLAPKKKGWSCNQPLRDPEPEGFERTRGDNL